MTRLGLLLLILLLLPSSALSGGGRVTVPLGDSPVRGAAEAPVTVVEFIDFQ